VPDRRTRVTKIGLRCRRPAALTRLWTVVVLICYIEADWSGRICTAGPKQWCNKLSAPTAETSAPNALYHLDTPPSFVSQRLCVWYAGHGRGEANKPSTDNKHGATDDNYPAHNRPIVRWSLVSILGSREIPFPESRKKIESRDSRVSLTVFLGTIKLKLIYKECLMAT